MIVEYAHAKLNLMLGVTNQRQDGYHDLVMINVPLALCDTLTFNEAETISLASSIEIEDNVILKTAKMLKARCNVHQGASITLQKTIPIGAGLGGESADIAATLRGLNRLWSLDLDPLVLEEIGIELGSDVPFCLYEKPAIVYGRGEQLIVLDPPPIKEILLIIPDLTVSTKAVFQSHRLKRGTRKAVRVVKDYLDGRYERFFKRTYNDLEKTTIRCYPALRQVRQLARHIDKDARMTGSGSAYFVIDAGKKEVQNIQKIGNMNVQFLKTTIKT
jgi:4-diphosphocytidyl-2-C-methyl-D-erythritol kinase